ncbi:VWA domain-containing protein [Candidatus Woesearchaeota archaeon]|nr:VWA domain-containing protein [Candidatus Woesearchaeota archaeon]
MAGSLDNRPKEFSLIDELSGKLKSDPEEKRLMKTILEDDKGATDDAHLILEAINQGIGALTPELMLEQIVKNYKLTKQLTGETIIRALTGYEPEQIERNLNIPEFRQELRERIRQKLDQLQKHKLIDTQYQLTDKALKLAALIIFTEEIDSLAAKGYGEKHRKRITRTGETEETKPYTRERYRDIAIRKTIKKAAKRGHTAVQMEDLESLERESKGRNTIIYALDASGSMKGKKLEQCKKAGVALAYKAIEGNDLVGVVVFGKQVRAEVNPTKDFSHLLHEIARIKALEQTDIAATIRKAAEMLEREKAESKKHLTLITDIMPTAGQEPEKETLEAVSKIASEGVTVSVIGISPDEEGRKLAEKIVEIGKGRFLVAKSIEDVDVLVLEDYYATIA